jgi:HAD superfamily hydrolase (TIGR01509 family)
MTAPVEAVIFDCDGTLIDSEGIGAQSLIEEAETLGLRFSAEEDLEAFRGRAMPTTLAILAERLGRPLPEGFEARARARMAVKFRTELKVIPGAHETLAALKPPVCIASNGPRAKMDLTLAVTGLAPFFAGRVFSAYEVGSFKPDPGLFLHAAAAMGARPERCVVVEDSVAGIEAGLAAGMRVFALDPLGRLVAPRMGGVTRLMALTDLCVECWNR